MCVIFIRTYSENIALTLATGWNAVSWRFFLFEALQNALVCNAFFPMVRNRRNAFANTTEFLDYVSEFTNYLRMFLDVIIEEFFVAVYGGNQ